MELVEEKLVNECPECGGAKFVTDHETGEIVCGSCGLVVDVEFSGKAQTKVFYDPQLTEKRLQHGVGATYLMHDKGLPTVLNVEKDAHGKYLTLAKKSEVARLSVLQKRMRVTDASERSLAEGFCKIDILFSKLGFANNYGLKEKAALIFRKVAKANRIRGRSIGEVAAGAVYFACRQSNIPKSLDDVSRAAGFHKKKVGASYRNILKVLQPPPRISALSYLSVIAEKTGASGEAQGAAARMLQALAEKKRTVGLDPRGLASAALYVACKQSSNSKDRAVTQKEISFASGVTEVTIRNRYKFICKVLNLQIWEAEA